MLLGTTIDLNNIQVPLAIFVTYFLVIVGFYSKSSQRFAKTVSIENKGRVGMIITFSILLLLFSIISVYLYSSEFGGIFSAISKASLIRSSVIEAGSLSFFKRFIFFSLFAAYLLASVVFIKEIKNYKFVLGCVFVISIIIFAISFMIMANRAVLVRSIVTFYLVYVIRKGAPSLSLMLVFLASSCIFVFYGKEIFASLTALPNGIDAVVERFQYYLDMQDKQEFSLEGLSGEISFPVSSIYAALNTPYEIRFLNDWIYGFLSFFPDRILEDLLSYQVPETLSFHNTYYQIKSNEYEIPSGFISSCLYSFSWAGVIIFSTLYGWLGRCLNNILVRPIKNIYWMPFIYIAAGLIWADFIPYADPKILLHTHFWFLSSTIILFFLGTKISFVKVNYYAHKSKK
ncbi:MAG: hypothetical protein AAFW70_03435 [Cyanobacteria bacterium J06635_10]